MRHPNSTLSAPYERRTSLMYASDET